MSRWCDLQTSTFIIPWVITSQQPLGHCRRRQSHPQCRQFMADALYLLCLTMASSSTMTRITSSQVRQSQCHTCPMLPSRGKWGKVGKIHITHATCLLTQVEMLSSTVSGMTYLPNCPSRVTYGPRNCIASDVVHHGIIGIHHCFSVPFLYIKVLIIWHLFKNSHPKVLLQ